MIVKLQPVAERQLNGLPRPAARKVVAALRVLARVPRSGRAFPESAARYAGMMFKVVRVRRGWSYRIVYEVLRDGIDVNLIVATWLDLDTIR